MRSLRGGVKVPAEVLDRAGLGRGDKPLAHASTDDGTWLLGTRDALVIVEPFDEAQEPPAEAIRVAWEQVETADWHRDEDRLRVVEVGEFGHPRPVHTFTVTEPGRLLSLVRERVTASVLIQRRVVVGARRGVMVIARRPPRGRGEITWACEYDLGVDPEDPEVQRLVDEAVRAAQDELGPGRQPI